MTSLLYIAEISLEDEIVGWHHRLNGQQFEQTPGDSEGWRRLACCSPWSCKELDTTSQPNNKWRVCVHACSVVSDSAMPWTVALQGPLSTEFSKQEYWSGLPFPPPGDLPDLGMEPASLVSPALSGRFFTS